MKPITTILLVICSLFANSQVMQKMEFNPRTTIFDKQVQFDTCIDLRNVKWIALKDSCPCKITPQQDSLCVRKRERIKLIECLDSLKKYSLLTHVLFKAD